ncbi:MAG TPA: Uma2 family endonuclease [Bryobacteraceae bacterium]|nr:Uma2 family endonuclease [Bryobacteraceae bacterium]
MNDDDYFAFCMSNPDLWLERTVEGEIVIVPPVGAECDHRSLDVGAQLGGWAERDDRGKVSGASTVFILPTGAALSPDAAWLSNRQLSQFSREQKRKFLPLCPEFIVEVMFPSIRLKTAQEKMEEWMRAGVELGWLIDGDERTVYVYRAGQAGAETRTGILKIAGEGPVAGFELDLTDIWAGL